LEFVLDPPAVTPDRSTKVKIIGAVFKDVKKIFIGTLWVRWRQINEYTLQITVPDRLELGAWDVLIRMKDKSELYFPGGLWVGEQPVRKEKGIEDKEPNKQGQD
jgi:hypothetical protein